MENGANPFAKLLELGFKAESNAQAPSVSAPTHKASAAGQKGIKTPKIKKPMVAPKHSPGTKSKRKAKSKKRPNSITLVKHNGILVAMTPAEVRRHAIAKQSALPSAKLSDKSIQRDKVSGHPKVSAPKKNVPKQKNSSIARPNSRPMNLAVDRIIADLPRRTMAELHQQWINTITMMASRNDKGLKKFRNALMEEWGRRFQLALDDPEHFDWPSTDAVLGDGSLKAGHWHNEGMLVYLGYHVGLTKGGSDHQRRLILDAVFGGPLPPLNGLDYVRQWAAPGTAPRLKKLAKEIARFAINAKRKKSAVMDSAIRDWEADLRYLYNQYYVGKFGFGWPVVG